MLSNSNNRFKVCVRVRPPLASELSNKTSVKQDKEECVRLSQPISQSSNQLILRQTGSDDRMFFFDYVLGYKASQALTYKCIGENIVNEVIHGYNGTIIAYGQTGSGKTYTVFGQEKSMNVSPRGTGLSVYEDGITDTGNIFCMYSLGIVFQAVGHIFRYIEDNCKSHQFRVTLSFYEIYMENIIDLLSTANNRDNLQIREDPSNGVYVHGLTKQAIRSGSEVVYYIKTGLKNRITYQTAMNNTSSRSHAIIQITLEQRWYEDVNGGARIETNKSSTSTGIGSKKKHMMKGILSIVDLAGSERLSKSVGNKLRSEEARNINKSISTLGNCIAALANEKMRTLGKIHIPFRDSKLTRVLSDCLGGKSKMSICACVSPIALNYEETYSTLLFASRAMMIKVSPQQNKNSFIKLRESTFPSNFHESMQYNELLLETQRLREQVQRMRSQSSESLQEDLFDSFPTRKKTTNSSETLSKTRSTTPNAWPPSKDRDSEKISIQEFTPRKKTYQAGSKGESSTFGAKELDIIKRYSEIIEHLQKKLLRKSSKIISMKEQLAKYKESFGDVQ